MFRDVPGTGIQHATPRLSLNCMMPKAYSDLAPLERLLYTGIHRKNTRRGKPTAWTKRNDGNSAAARAAVLIAITATRPPLRGGARRGFEMRKGVPPARVAELAGVASRQHAFEQGSDSSFAAATALPFGREKRPHNRRERQPIHGRQGRRIRWRRGEPAQEVAGEVGLMGRPRPVDEG